MLQPLFCEIHDWRECRSIRILLAHALNDPEHAEGLETLIRTVEHSGVLVDGNRVMIVIVGDDDPTGLERIFSYCRIFRPRAEFVYFNDALNVVADSAKLLGEFSLCVLVE